MTLIWSPEESRKKGGDRERDIAPGRTVTVAMEIPYSCRFDSAGTLEGSALACVGDLLRCPECKISAREMCCLAELLEGELPLLTSSTWPAVGTPTTAAC